MDRSIYYTISERLAPAFGSIPFASFCTFGVLPWIVFNFGYFGSIEFERNPYAASSIYVSSLWIIAAPVLIVQWETARQKFIGSACTIDGLMSNSTNCDRLWPYMRWTCGALFSITSVWLHVYTIDSLVFFRDIQPWSWTWTAILFVLITTGYATGVGVAGAIYTTMIFLRLKVDRLNWRPYHPDGRGGFAFLADFAFLTTVCFFGGVMVIPAATIIANIAGGLGGFVLYSVMIGYGGLISLAFFLPMQRIYVTATNQKRIILGSIGRSLDDSVTTFLLSGRWEDKQSTNSRVKCDSDVEKIGYLYDHVAGISAAPFSVPTVARVIGLALGPLIVAVAQLILEKALEGNLGG